jgi:hypothetical protein
VVAHRKGDVDLVRVERYTAGDERDLVESVSAACPSADADLEARLIPGNCAAGFEPALIQGAFTPMAAGFGELYGMHGDCGAQRTTNAVNVGRLNF